jgi:glutamate racemase
MGPIGVFDSGYGGLTILNDLRERLPQYDYLYLGDNARAPYGIRSFDVVYEFTLQAVNELFDRGCELVILACNTASAKALRTIQQKDLPIIAPNKRVLGVIRPSAEIVGGFTSTNAIGILATPGTVQSRSYEIEIGNFAPNCEVYQQACPLWVTLIENNEHETDAGKEFIRHDVEALLAKNERIDTIVLGCTHFPVLKTYIESIIPENIRVIAQGKIVAKSLMSYLERHPEMEVRCSKEGTVHYLTSESTKEFDQNAGKYTNEIIRSTHIQLH